MKASIMFVNALVSICILLIAPAQVYAEELTQESGIIVGNVIEATSFRLKQGITVEAFLAANQEVNAWVQAQEGFQSRLLTQKKNAGWLDILIWENENVASEIDELFYRDMGDSEFMQLLDPESVETSFSTVIVKLP